jgi:hypothetical protein
VSTVGVPAAVTVMAADRSAVLNAHVYDPAASEPRHVSGSCRAAALHAALTQSLGGVAREVRRWRVAVVREDVVHLRRVGKRQLDDEHSTLVLPVPFAEWHSICSLTLATAVKVGTYRNFRARQDLTDRGVHIVKRLECFLADACGHLPTHQHSVATTVHACEQAMRASAHRWASGHSNRRVTVECESQYTCSRIRYSGCVVQG